MNKRAFLSIAAAALVAIPAQAAVAAPGALDPTRPDAPTGVGPTFDEGAGTPAGTPMPEPEATEPTPEESIPAPAEQGASTSPGAVEPTFDEATPVAPEPHQAAGDEGEEDPKADCSALRAEWDGADAMASLGLVFGNIFNGPAGSFLRDEGVDSADEAERIEGEAREQGCAWAQPASPS